MLTGREKLTDEASALEAADVLSAGGASLSRVSVLADDSATEQGQKNTVSANKHGRFNDPSFPLADSQREQIAQALARDIPSADAYQQAGHHHAIRKTAQSQVSRMLREPAFSARLQYLRSRRRAEDDAKRVGVSGGDEPLTVAEMERILSRDARDCDDPSERVGAIKLLHTLRAGSGDVLKPDPAYLLEYLRQAADQGRDVADTTTCCGLSGDRPPVNDQNGVSRSIPTKAEFT